ncbi:MAG: DUF2269 family protein [Beijerinckiaceae bacterium]
MTSRSARRSSLPGGPYLAAAAAAAAGAPLPARYHRIFWIWFAFGFPAFAAVLGILWLMIARPQMTII